jgi:radical SAM protein with 4Fe4S-binding SPASM domain
MVEVGTSFQYGEGRQITPGKVFTQEIFEEVYRMFNRYIPEKSLCFLAVIDESNKAKAIDHVLLAKKLNTQCRLVYANKSGRSGDVLPVSEMTEIYIQIWKMGLSEYEQTCYSYSEKYRGIEVGCNMSRSCDSFMRSLNPDGRYFSCGPLNDDLDTENEIDFKKEMAGEFFTPIRKSKHQFLKEECLSCKLFEICNGCVKHIKDLKETNKVESHCKKMKSLEKDFIEMATSPDIKELLKRTT